MEITCKNCQQIYKGHYCNNCGQSAHTHKINGHFLWHEIQHGLLHFDQGIPYSIKQLFTRPGDSIREFIEGKRVRHFKPLSLVVVLAAFYGFLYHYYDINLFPATKDNSVDYSQFNELMASHYSWITISCIPLYTIGTYIAFRKQGYNFFEYFVLNTFKASQRLFIQILIFPVLLYYKGTSHVQDITNFFYVIGLFLIFWTNIQFFNRISKTKVFFLSVLSHIIFLVCFIIIFMIILAILGKLPL